MAQEQGSIIELIRKCLALSTSSNEHEAARAAAKAQELLFKYNLSMAEIEASADASEEKVKVTKDYTDLKTTKNQGRWKMSLIHKIARHSFCDIISSGRDRAIIIGQPHNIMAVQELYIWTAVQIERLAHEACRSYCGYDRIPTFRRSFLESAALTVGNRLYRQWMDSQKESEASTALVVNHKAMVQNYVEQEFPELRMGRAFRGSGSYDGHQAGRAAGERVNLVAQRKLGGSNQGRLS